MDPNADGCLPDSVKDFVFDLHDATRRSLIPSEQHSLYTGTFREVTAKYFATSAWPTAESVAPECDNDTLFLALYSELALRHYQGVSRPSVRDRVDGWHAYRTLFDALLDEAPPDESEGEGGEGGTDEKKGDKPKDKLCLVPEWCFDVLHEFLYQFQGFCQFRTASYGNAARASSDPEKTVPGHIRENLDVLSKNRDAWAVETVLYYLHRLVAVGSRANASTTYRSLAHFAGVTLNRLECLLGDYRASVAAFDALRDPNAATVSVGEEVKTPEELVNGVFPARLSLAYHAGVSYMMLRRHKDAARALGEICLFMQRGFKTGQLRKIPGSEQFNKLFDRMIALLAILTHVCPHTNTLLDDAIANVVREKHSNNLSKIEAGEEGYEDLFVFACPKFVNPAVPDYDQALQPGASPVPHGRDAYKLQVRQFMNEMACHTTLRKMRSYMSLYTSIGVDKLAAFNDMTTEEFEPWLACFKHKMRQLECASGSKGDGAEGAPVEGGVERMGTAMDIHYYAANGLVHVDEAEKTRRFETFFMKQIDANNDILRQVEQIQTDV